MPLQSFKVTLVYAPVLSDPVVVVNVNGHAGPVSPGLPSQVSAYVYAVVAAFSHAVPAVFILALK